MNLAQLILEVFPSDAILRIDEVHDRIREATDKPYKRESIRAVLFRLHKSGDLQRVKAGRTWRKVRYCRPECTVTAGPITIEAWAALIQADSERELNPAEIMVRMIERGYEPQVEPAESLKHLRWVL
jgi:hypothetical protein